MCVLISSPFLRRRLRIRRVFLPSSSFHNQIKIGGFVVGRSAVRASKPNLFSLAFSFPVYIFNFLPFPPRSVFPYQPPLIASKGKKAKIFFFPGHPATGFPCLFSQLLALKQKDICILGTKNWEDNNLEMQMINRYTVFSAISGLGLDFLIN